MGGRRCSDSGSREDMVSGTVNITIGSDNDSAPIASNGDCAIFCRFSLPTRTR